MGDSVDLGPSASAPELKFRPLGSNAPIFSRPGGAWAIAPDVLGDYVVEIRGDVRRYRAIAFPTAAAGQPAERFADSFRGGGVASSDGEYGWWAPSSDAAAACHFDEEAEGRGLVMHGPPCSLESPREAALVSRAVANFFAEPIVVHLDGVVLNSSALVLLRLRALAANDDAADAAAALTLTIDGKTATLSAAAPLLSQPLPLGCCDGPAGCALSLHLDVRNATLETRCAGCFAANASGAHGVSLSDWGPRPLGGASQILVGVDGAGWAAVRGLRVVSALVPGGDRLRPGSRVPAMPAALAPMTDGVGGFTPRALVATEELGAAQPLAPDGFVDVTAPPFSADNTGAADATAAIQRAIDYAKWHYYSVWLPIGEYRVTAPLLARQVSRALAAGYVTGPLPHGAWAKVTPAFILDGVPGRYAPVHIRGELDATRPGARATLRVPPRTPAFMNASSPAYVLACVFDNAMGLREPNAMYNSVLQSVNVVVGEGNAGAVGLRWRGAQGTGVEDVRIEFEGRGPSDGLAGLVGAAGSGGAHHGVTVIGGRYGLDLRQGQPSATVSRATLVNQSCAAVLYEGFEALTAVGVAVSGLRGCVAVRAGFPLALPPAGDACALPPMDNGGQQMPLGTVAGAVALIDARVAWADGANTCAERAVVRTNRSLYLRNLYARAAHTIARFDASAVAAPAAAGGGWSAVHELAHGENPDPQTAGDGKGGKVTFQTLATAYVGGRRSPPGATALAEHERGGGGADGGGAAQAARLGGARALPVV